jgi:sugar phosphate permease
MATASSPERKQSAGSRQTALALTLLVMAGCLNYIDRVSLSIAHGPVKAALHLSETQIGTLLSVFTLTYALTQLPIGPLSDRFGTRRVLGFGLTLWSVAQLLVSRIASLGQFFACRALLGIGEAPYYPASIQLIHSEVSKARRSRALALSNSAAMIGPVIAPPLLTVLMLGLGWRSMFAVTGAVGLVLSAAWFFFLSEKRPAHIEDGDDPPVPAPPDAAPAAQPERLSLERWLHLFGDPTIWLLMGGFAGVNYAAWFYIAWLPAYLENGRGLSIAHTGWLAALPYIGATMGMQASGWLADRRIARGKPAARVHLHIIIAGMLLSSAATLLVSHISTITGAMATIIGALFCLHFAGTAGWGYAQAIAPRPIVATVCSIQNFGSQMVGALAPFLTGWILDRTHSFTAAFVLCGAMSASGALCYVVLLRTRVTHLRMPAA